MDVIGDLKEKSKTYKDYISINLSEDNKKSIFIPRVCAHGFKSLKNNTITVYNVTSEHSPSSASAIHHDSFGFDWQIELPIVS